jgi:hypothetical protein
VARSKKLQREYFLKNRKRIASRRRKLYAENPQKILSYNRSWNAKNKEQISARRRQRKYGIEFNKLFDQQSGSCGICSLQMVRGNRNKRAANVDHDHETGQVRGLLCHTCNLGLGHFNDNPTLLRQAANYIERKT